MAEEKLFENKIKRWLKEHNCYHIKYWGGGSFTKSGVPDILASVNGKFVGIEVKAQTGRPSELQLYHLREIRSSCGYAWIVYPSGWNKLQECLEAILHDREPSYEEEFLK